MSPLHPESVSVAGVETCLGLPAYGLCFDIGRCPEFALAYDTVLVTHAHNDHVAGLPYHAARRALAGAPAPTYYVPVEVAEDVRAMMDAHGRCDRAALRYHLIPVAPGMVYDLPRRSGGVSVRVFESVHRVPCYGYIIEQTREKLRPNYEKLPGEEIKKLRQKGVPVTYPAIVKEVAYTGDTTAEVFDRVGALRTVKHLITECSFFGSEVTVEGARSRGHVHLDELVAQADSFANKRVTLVHFSARYTEPQIIAAMEELPPPLRARASAWTSGHRKRTP